jgi:hypothetical protein
MSTDAGTSWNQAGLTNAVVQNFAVIGTNLFAGWFKEYPPGGNGLSRSTDKGKTWMGAYSGLPLQGVVGLAAIGTNLFASVSGDGIFGSIDSGMTWNSLPEQTGSMYSFAVMGTNLFAAGLNCRVFLSTNNGAYWTEADYGLPGDGVIQSLAVIETNLFAADPGGGIWLSTNQGASWTLVNPLRSGWAALAVSGTNLFLGDWDGVSLSSDNGTSWTPVNQGLMNLPTVTSLAVSEKYLFAGTDETGVLRRSLSEMLDVKSAQPRPSQYALYQNYPNPFNPSTTIKFELPRASQVNLSVFDILGRQVSVLVNEKKEAGVHEVKFNGSNLASGVYFYRLQAGDFVATKRLLLLK